MLKSMTAYSRSVLASSSGRFVVELQSVNRKHLEINTFLPRPLIRFDSEIKKWVAHVVHRGQVNVRVSVVFEQDVSVTVRPNLALAAQLKASWDEITAHLGLSGSLFNLDLLSEQEGLFIHEDVVHEEGAVKSDLQKVFLEALQQLETMKLCEGEALQQDISYRLGLLKDAVGKIAEKAPDAVGRYHERLLAKLRETLGSLSLVEADERLLKEVCLFADKVDIAEEITRFRSHLMQFESMLANEQNSIGKTLEFLVQELNREVNTIGSKSADAEISSLVIQMKTELERIREQIQNVE